MLITEKYCPRCDKTKPVSEWPKAKSRKDGLGTQCKACQKEWRDANKEHLAEYQAEYYKKNADSQKEYSKTHWMERGRDIKFGLEPGTINEMLIEQGFRCANPGCLAAITWSSCDVDHDHSCCNAAGKSCGKCVRGLLCHNCNIALGCVGDNKEVLSGLVKYLNLEEC